MITARKFFPMPDRFTGGELLAVFTGTNSRADAEHWAETVTHYRLVQHRLAFRLQTSRTDETSVTRVLFAFDSDLCEV